MEGNFLEKDLSYKLMGCFFKIRNLYGGGMREKFYDEVSDEIMREAKLVFINKPRIELFSFTTGRLISYFVPDKLVEDKIIVEYKAKPFLAKEDIGQANEYLKITKYEILYLVNFGEKNFEPRRLIQTNDRKPFLNLSSVSKSVIC
ncbi:MAG: GxxExxY protein [Patescibacteria group bacterium]